MADSPATSLTIASVAEDGDLLRLAARALPYRPLTFSGKQRAEFTWYPGSPIATAQMLGPEESAITLKGFWKDRFLSNETGTAAARYGADEIGTVRVLTQLVDGMRRRGQLYKLTWDELVRVGHITGFTQTWHNAHDCEWEIEFTPISQGDEETPVVLNNLPNVADYYQQTASAVNTARSGLRIRVPLPTATAINDSVPELTAPTYSQRLSILAGAVELAATLGPRVAGILSELDDALLGLQNNAYNTAASVYSLTLVGSDAGRRMVALAAQNIAQARRTYATVTDVSWPTVFNVSPADPNDVNIGAQVAMRAYQRRVRESTRDLAYQQGTQASAILSTLNPELKAAFVAPQNMDLRDVSTQFYGTPDSWRDLLVFNKLESSRLTAGTLIWVPQRSNSSATTRGY